MEHHLKALGIFRERAHSPNREFDDAEILRQTADRFRDLGAVVDVVTPEEALLLLPKLTVDAYDLIFMMCEQEGIVKELERLENLGVRLVNSTQGIRNTYRTRMIPLLEKASVGIPLSPIVSTANPQALAALSPFRAVWVKRGDVHNTQAGDVSLAQTPEEVQAALTAMAARKIPQAVLQDHVPGDLVKFYGVGTTEKSWFRWFYHKAQDLKNYPFAEEDLRRAVFQAAGAIRLEVFGGDAVIDSSGRVYLIDINAWPSFALFRGEASEAIAQHLQSLLAASSPS